MNLLIDKLNVPPEGPNAERNSRDRNLGQSSGRENRDSSRQEILNSARSSTKRPILSTFTSLLGRLTHRSQKSLASNLQDLSKVE